MSLSNSTVDVPDFQDFFGKKEKQVSYPSVHFKSKLYRPLILNEEYKISVVRGQKGLLLKLLSLILQFLPKIKKYNSSHLISPEKKIYDKLTQITPLLCQFANAGNVSLDYIANSLQRLPRQRAAMRFISSRLLFSLLVAASVSVTRKQHRLLTFESVAPVCL